MTSLEQDSIFLRWLREHQGLLRRVTRSFAETQADQEDLLQEILLHAWSSLPTFRSESKETTWLYRLALNTAMVWQRKEQRRRLKHEAFSAFLAHDAVTPHGENSEKEELIERLYSAIRRLPKLDASLALLCLDGLSHREMGDVLGITENHIGVRLHRIRKQLAEQLKGNHDEL
jgi:RNA polymerase sigma-70 factor, ECF subfamily